MSDVTELAKKVTKDGTYLPLLMGILFTAIGLVGGIAVSNMMTITKRTFIIENATRSIESNSTAVTNIKIIQNQTALQLQKLTILVAQQQNSNERQDHEIERIDSYGSRKWQDKSKE